MHTFVLSMFKVDRCNENMNKNNINKIQYFSVFILLFKLLCRTSPNHSYSKGSQFKNVVHKCTWPVWRDVRFKGL